MDGYPARPTGFGQFSTNWWNPPLAGLYVARRVGFSPRFAPSPLLLRGVAGRGGGRYVVHVILPVLNDYAVSYHGGQWHYDEFLTNRNGWTGCSLIPVQCPLADLTWPVVLVTCQPSTLLHSATEPSGCGKRLGLGLSCSTSLLCQWWQ